MKIAIAEPGWRALKTPKTRKETFDKYIRDARAEDKEREAERLEKLRRDFTQMLRTHPEVKTYTRWKTACPIIQGETAFRSASDDAERHQLFDEYIQTLKKEQAEQTARDREEALDVLPTILRSIRLSPNMTTLEVEQILEKEQRFADNAKFKSLPRLELLAKIESHIRDLAEEYNRSSQREKDEAEIKEAQARNNFRATLESLRSRGSIRADSKWSAIYPILSADQSYQAMLENAEGTSPLELFYSTVDEEEQSIRADRRVALAILDKNEFEITADTTEEQFMAVMTSDSRTQEMGPTKLLVIYNRLIEQTIRNNEKERVRAEQKKEEDVERLYNLLRETVRVHITDDFEKDILPRLEMEPLYKDIGDEELAYTAFSKVMLRLRGRERPKHSDREYRPNGHRKGTRDGRSRSPGPDPYEADRRRHTAAREEHHRRSRSPLSARQRKKQSREWDRSIGGRLGGTGYDDERRMREPERERAYRSWDDPMDGGPDPLNYGESGGAGSMSGGSSRRRRDSDDHEPDQRSAKRTRRLEPSEEVQQVKENQPGETTDPRGADEDSTTNKVADNVSIKSGSEEGEIEEN